MPPHLNKLKAINLQQKKKKRKKKPSDVCNYLIQVTILFIQIKNSANVSENSISFLYNKNIKKRNKNPIYIYFFCSVIHLSLMEKPPYKKRLIPQKSTRNRRIKKEQTKRTFFFLFHLIFLYFFVGW